MAQDKRRRFGGARYNKPHELHDKLKALGRYYNEFYDDIMRNAFITWDLDAHEVWVEARFRATKMQMIGWTDLSQSRFYIKWRKIVEADLIRVEEDGVFVLTMVIRKEDVGVSDAEMKRMQQRQLGMLEEHQEMKEDYQRVIAILEELKAEKDDSDSSELQDVITSNYSCVQDKKASSQDKKASSQESISLLGLKDRKISLSEANLLITSFYKSIGQNRIPKAVRDKANASIKELGKAGYLSGEIAYALDWIPKNAKEPVEHFGIVPHMIEEAVAAGKKELETEETRQAAIESQEKVQRDKIAEQHEGEILRAYKAQLSVAERTELRETALVKLGEMEEIKSDYISEPLVDAMENRLIREAGIDLSAFRDIEIE